MVAEVRRRILKILYILKRLNKLGREHALAWKLQQSKNVAKIFVYPGSIGISEVQKTKIIGSDEINLKDFKVC